MDYRPWLWVAAVPAVLVGQIYLLGRKMSEPEKMISPVMGGLNPHQEQTISQYKDWLDSVNLRYLINFKFGSILVAVYQ